MTAQNTDNPRPSSPKHASQFGGIVIQGDAGDTSRVAVDEMAGSTP
jgi:hypothetical protein